MNQNDKEAFDEWFKKEFGDLYDTIGSHPAYETHRATFLSGIQYERNRQSEVLKDLEWIIDMTTFGQRKNEKVTASEFYEKAQKIKDKYGLGLNQEGNQ
jgi:hypothetical protein